MVFDQASCERLWLRLGKVGERSLADTIECFVRGKLETSAKGLGVDLDLGTSWSRARRLCG